MTRRVCVVTGSRAEYGLLRGVLDLTQRDSDLVLQLVIAGMHLSPHFGATYHEIENDGFPIAGRVEMLLSSDTPAGLAKSMGLGMIAFADLVRDLEPDVMVVLGDRFEIMAAVSAALMARIPVAHLHGGEASEGAYDEAIRHAVTKMSHLHFVAAPEYRARVIQLGEHPDRVFVVGALGVDAISRMTLLDLTALERQLGFTLGAKSLLVTFHPATLEPEESAHQIEELLAAVAPLADTTLIFTMPNADTTSLGLWRTVEGFVRDRPNAHAFQSLGHPRYLSCMSYVDGVVGNSSSGLIEAPTFRKGTVNIGDRQRGRLKAASVIDCPPERGAIARAIDKLYTRDFQSSLTTVRNPYGEAGASERIVNVLKTHSLDGIVKKSFYDLPESINN